MASPGQRSARRLSGPESATPTSDLRRASLQLPLPSTSSTKQPVSHSKASPAGNGKPPSTGRPRAAIPSPTQAHVCGHCGRGFNREYNLERHIPACEGKQHGCLYCDLKFNTLAGARQHMKLKHKEHYTAELEAELKAPENIILEQLATIEVTSLKGTHFVSEMVKKTGLTKDQIRKKREKPIYAQYLARAKKRQMGKPNILTSFSQSSGGPSTIAPRTISPLPGKSTTVPGTTRAPIPKTASPPAAGPAKRPLAKPPPIAPVPRDTPRRKPGLQSIAGFFRKEPASLTTEVRTAPVKSPPGGYEGGDPQAYARGSPPMTSPMTVPEDVPSPPPRCCRSPEPTATTDSPPPTAGAATKSTAAIVPERSPAVYGKRPRPSDGSPDPDQLPVNPGKRIKVLRIDFFPPPPPIYPPVTPAPAHAPVATNSKSRPIAPPIPSTSVVDLTTSPEPPATNSPAFVLPKSTTSSQFPTSGAATAPPLTIPIIPLAPSTLEPPPPPPPCSLTRQSHFKFKLPPTPSLNLLSLAQPPIDPNPPPCDLSIADLTLLRRVLAETRPSIVAERTAILALIDTACSGNYEPTKHAFDMWLAALHPPARSTNHSSGAVRPQQHVRNYGGRQDRKSVV